MAEYWVITTAKVEVDSATFFKAQAFNILWTLLFAYLIFGGILFPVPKF